MTRQPDTLPEYNGWRNKPTWAVDLWLNNDQDTYNDLRGMLHEKNDMDPDEALRLYVESIAEDAIATDYELERRGLVDNLVPGLARDLLTWALAYVDWHEIVEGLQED